MKRVIVTGGAGFIGSHLAAALVKRNYRVTILDNLLTGKLENIHELLGGGKVDFVQGSITELPLLQDVFRQAEFVFHLAALTRVADSVADPLTTNEINVTGTLNVLLASRDSGVKKVVYASSCAVYGDTANLPVTEEEPPRPLSPYALTKLVGEQYCRLFHRLYGLASVSLRYFNVYGPRQDYRSQYAAAIPTIINGVNQGSAPVIFGDGEQTRDFSFVEDVAAVTILAAESGATGVYNIGSGQSITINELAQTITGLMQKDLKAVYAEPRPGDIRHSLADISTARGFGYNPQCDLLTGLARTIEAMQPSPAEK